MLPWPWVLCHIWFKVFCGATHAENLHIEDNCFSDLSSIPVCADPNWTLYQGAYKGKFFCCPSDEIGLLPDNSQAGQCAKKSQIVPSSRSASKVCSCATSISNPFHILPYHSTKKRGPHDWFLEFGYIVSHRRAYTQHLESQLHLWFVSQ